MSTRQRRSRVRSTSVAYACPACQTILGTVDRCPNCHFTGADTMGMFEGEAPPIEPVTDLAELWDEDDLKQILRARKRVMGRFPQFRWSICTVNLPAEANLRLYGFWMLNVNALRADESETDRLWTILLLINAAANKAAAIPAYAAEPWLGNDQWDKALASMVPAWKVGAYGRGVADFLASATLLLESSWRQVQSNPSGDSAS